MITSTGNAQIKNVVQLRKKGKERKKQDLFLVEGIKMLLEAPPQRIARIYLSHAFYQEHKNNPALQGALDQAPVELVSDEVFAYMSDTKAPQGALCLVRQYHYRMEDLFGSCPLCVVTEHLQDPGNLGTVLRTAEGAGVTGVILSSDTVDLYNPKVIRSTMGSIYRMPFIYVENLQEVLMDLKIRGIGLYAAHLGGSLSYVQPDYKGPSAFLIGNESQGLSEETALLADVRVRIPMAGRVESLNAAVAAALLMYEAARQRAVFRC